MGRVLIPARSERVEGVPEEVFVVVDGEEEARMVGRLNTWPVKRLIQRRWAHVRENGATPEAAMPGVSDPLRTAVSESLRRRGVRVEDEMRDFPPGLLERVRKNREASHE